MNGLNVRFFFVLFDDDLLIIKGVFFGHFESVVRRVLKAPFWLFEDFEEVRGDFLRSLNCKKETGVLEVDGKLDFE